MAREKDEKEKKKEEKFRKKNLGRSGGEKCTREGETRREEE